MGRPEFQPTGPLGARVIGLVRMRIRTDRQVIYDCLSPHVSSVAVPFYRHRKSSYPLPSLFKPIASQTCHQIQRQRRLNAAKTSVINVEAPSPVWTSDVHRLRKQRANTDSRTVISKRAKPVDDAGNEAAKAARKKEIEALEAQTREDPLFAEAVAEEEKRLKTLKKLAKEDKVLHGADRAKERASKAHRTEEGDPHARAQAEAEAEAYKTVEMARGKQERAGQGQPSKEGESAARAGADADADAEASNRVKHPPDMRRKLLRLRLGSRADASGSEKKGKD